MLTTFSVRTRIVVLALIPVAGFLANGLTYTSGEGDVGTRFHNRQAIHRAGGRQPRFQERGRGDAPRRQGFHRQRPATIWSSVSTSRTRLALKALDTISTAIDRTRAENIVSMRKDVTALRKNFDDLVREQKILGFDEAIGLARQSAQHRRQRGRTHHQREHDVAGRGRRHELDDVAAVHAALRSRISASIQDEVARQQFERGYKKFTDIFAQYRRHAADEVMRSKSR